MRKRKNTRVAKILRANVKYKHNFEKTTLNTMR